MGSIDELGADQLSSVCDLLRDCPRPSASAPVICRPGTSSDVFESQSQKNESKERDKSRDQAGSDYSEVDFQRDFFESDDLAAYEMDPRSEIAAPSWTEVLAADSMGVTRSTEAAVRVRLPEEDGRTIDVHVTDGGTLLLVHSHKYKLRWFLPEAVVNGGQRATWDGQTDTLTVTVKLRPKRSIASD